MSTSFDKVKIASTIDDAIVSYGSKITADCALTVNDVAKVCNGLQSCSTGTALDINTISITDTLSTRPTFDEVKKMIKEEITNNKEEEKKKNERF